MSHINLRSASQHHLLPMHIGDEADAEPESDIGLDDIESWAVSTTSGCSRSLANSSCREDGPLKLNT